ncbi:MAG TPA: T9SS type A sorting domain-containing protein [Chitinophagaceae bacterium]|nr:T9SS type A sorting domain-containing protein [Chitinophagaceae bacterium]
MSKIFTHRENKQDQFLSKFYSIVTGLIILFAGTASAQSDSLVSSNHPANYIEAARLGQFTGGYSSGFVQLQWSTSTENDMKHFEIERSTDGINYRKIGKTLAKGDVNIKSEYTYLDILADKGSNFYRLVIIDKDGNFTYSKPITITVEKGISLFVVYPNPFGKKVLVKFNSDGPDQAIMRIIDNTGKVITTQTDPVQKGENKLAIRNVDNLPGGIYYLELVTKDKNIRTKLMKQQSE